MHKWWVVLGGVLAASACASPSAFQVGIFGDIPYVTTESERSEKLTAYRHLLSSFDTAKLQFVVHIGDFAYAAQCSDSVYVTRQAEFARVPHPLVYMFGDNEWVDCQPPYDPSERLVRLRTMFTKPESGSLGARSMPLVRQAGWPENARWSIRQITFLTLNVVGSNNNWGADSVPSAEWQERHRANLDWLRQSFEAAQRERSLAIAVFMQANPLPAPRPGRPNGFAELMAEFRRLAIEFDRPVALVHGDTHYFRIDKPFTDPQTRRVYPLITRAETFGDPNSHWLVMRVDPKDPAIFSFAPVIVAENMLRGQ